MIDDPIRYVSNNGRTVRISTGYENGRFSLKIYEGTCFSDNFEIQLSESLILIINEELDNLAQGGADADEIIPSIEKLLRSFEEEEIIERGDIGFDDDF